MTRSSPEESALKKKRKEKETLERLLFLEQWDPEIERNARKKNQLQRFQPG